MALTLRGNGSSSESSRHKVSSAPRCRFTWRGRMVPRSADIQQTASLFFPKKGEGGSNHHECCLAFYKLASMRHCHLLVVLDKLGLALPPQSTRLAGRGAASSCKKLAGRLASARADICKAGSSGCVARAIPRAIALYVPDCMPLSDM